MPKPTNWQCERKLTVTLTSSINNAEWVDFVEKVYEEVQQLACDAAAASSDDTYSVEMHAEPPGTGP